jgi:hypothetical protein
MWGAEKKFCDRSSVHQEGAATHLRLELDPPLSIRCM